MSETVVEIGEKDLAAQDKTLWLKAISAVQLKNEAYAVNLILPVVQNNPGFLEGRQLLRKCQSIACESQSGGGTKVFGISIGGGSKGASSKLKSLAKKDPKAAMGEIEKELSEEPFNPELSNLLHDCAAQLAMISTAEFALETIRQYAPDQTKFLHKLASFYMGEKKFTEAAGVFHTISEQDPTDSSAIKGEKDCMAKASMMSSTTTSGELAMKDVKRSIDLEKQAKTGLTREQYEERKEDLMVKYGENQHDFATVMSLGETYENLEEFADAHAFYSWAFQLSENDKTIQSKADAMKNRANQQAVTYLEKAVAEDPGNAELIEQLNEMKAQASSERITECEARVEENPTDGLLRYDLGKAYFSVGRADDAIPHLQQAKSNPAIETKVLLLLGQTFDMKGMTDMAISQLERADSKLIVMDGIKKEVLYQLALLQQKSGNKESYVKCLKQIYEVDYNYRDVSTRVEQEYGG